MGKRYLDPTASEGLFPLSHKQAILSARESETLRLLASGYTNQEIAARLFVSVKTVETYRARIMVKLEAKTRAEIVRYAMNAGLLDSELD